MSSVKSPSLTLRLGFETASPLKLGRAVRAGAVGASSLPDPAGVFVMDGRVTAWRYELPSRQGLSGRILFAQPISLANKIAPHPQANAGHH